MIKNNKINENTGFTLAEVLIALVIIGIIAAITVPSIIQTTKTQEYISALKAVNSILAQAYSRAIADNGPPDTWDIGTQGSADGSKKLHDYFKPYFIKIKECNHSTGCFADSYRAMFSSEPYIFQPNSSNVYSKTILNNGAILGFWTAGSGCNYTGGSANRQCGSIKVDINGVRPQNRAGVDLFNFGLSADGRVVPSYLTKTNKNTYGEYCKYNDSSRYNGVSCTGWVISHGNMDYLKRDVSQ